MKNSVYGVCGWRQNLNVGISATRHMVHQELDLRKYNPFRTLIQMDSSLIEQLRTEMFDRIYRENG